MALPESTIVDNLLKRQGIARSPTRVRRQKGEPILRRLRQRVDARPVLAEHLHRRRSGRAEIVGGAGEGDMEFGLIAAPAKVGIDASQLRGRMVAPAGVV